MEVHYLILLYTDVHLFKPSESDFNPLKRLLGQSLNATFKAFLQFLRHVGFDPSKNFKIFDSKKFSILNQRILEHVKNFR